MNFPYRKILVVAADHVGNNIFCTPGIHFLKKHLVNSLIDVVSLNRRSAGVFADNPDIHAIHIVKREKALKKLAGNYDFILVLHPDKTQHYFDNLKIPVAVIPGWSSQKHRADDILEFIQKLLGKSIEAADRQYHLHCSSSHDEQIEAFLKNITTDIKLIGLHLGNGRTAIHGWKFWYGRRAHDSRLWPLENYIYLAQQLKQHYPNIKFVLTGSGNEKFLAKKFLQTIPDAINLMGKTSLQSLQALMKQLRFFIAGDTGALHVACSTPVEIIGLFSHTDPALTGPYPLSPQHTIIKKNENNHISVEDVSQIVLTKL